MPPFHSLGESSIKEVVAYLRVLQGKRQSVRLPGDPDRGHDLFFGKGRCGECHLANGKGGFIASDLTTWGQGRASAEIRSAILQPGSDSDRRTKIVSIMTRDGQELSGIIRAEDNFSIDLQTISGQFVLVQRTDLATLKYNSDPLMPRDYGNVLTPAELNDLISYLMTIPQKSAKPSSRQKSKRNWEDD